MGTKFLDQVGLQKVVTSIAQKIDSKLGQKVSAVLSADDTKLHVDITDPVNPKISLGADTANKINTLWAVNNDGTGPATMGDTDIDAIFTDVFK